MSTAPDSNADDAILCALNRILHRVADHDREASRQASLTVPQLLVLRAVGRAPEPTPIVVAREVHLSPSTITGVLDRLETAGLVERERSDTDRRKVVLALTEAGRERVGELPTPLDEYFRVRLAGLPAGERAELRLQLERVVELLGAAELEATPVLGVVPMGRSRG